MTAPARPSDAPARAALPALTCVIALAAHVLLAHDTPPRRPSVATLPAAPAPQTLRALSAGEPEFAAAAILLALQHHDDRQGVHRPLLALDHDRLAAWLDLALALDGGSDYPLLLAALVYAQVPDPRRQRLMLDVVQRAFRAAPERRWRWLAHAALVARHRLHDEALALRYAEDIALQATAAPSWARQMHIFIRADRGERALARQLLAALLAGDAVRDPAERRFLAGRLQALETGIPSLNQELP